MSDAGPPYQALLERARALDGVRDYPALARLLDGLPEGAAEAEPELGFLHADVLRRVGRGPEALAALEALAPVLARRGNDRLHRRRLNLLGSLLFELGRVDDARETWGRQLDDAVRGGDEEFVARANNNLGVVSTLHGRLPDALAHYGRAVTSYRALGYRRGLAQSHHNLGITYREMGFLSEADDHFRRAGALAREDGGQDEMARVEQERAFLQYLMGDPALARDTARRAAQRYAFLEDPVGAGEVARVLGLVALGEGEVDEADAALARALGLAREAEAVLLEAETLEARAALERSRGDDAAAESAEESADELFDRIGAPGWGRAVRARARAVAARTAWAEA